MRYIQNRITGSRYALPFTATVIAALWLIGFLIRQWDVPTTKFLLIAISSLCVVVMNNENSLIRIYSRMVSCTFLVFSSLMAFDVMTTRGAACQFLFLLTLLLLFRCYQDRRAVGLTYYAFVCLGLLSLLYIRIILIVPFIWLFMAFLLISMSIRTLVASLLGLITPYWFIAAIALYNRDVSILINFFNDILPSFSNDIFNSLSPKELCFFVILSLLSIFSSIHFLRFNYKDKIRTRLLYYFFIQTQLLLTALFVMCPEDKDVLLPLLVIPASPLIAHAAALSSSRVSNILFLVSTSTLFLALVFISCNLL